MSHVFEPDVLREISREAAGLEFDPMTRTLIAGLRARYGDHIAPEDPLKWVWSLAGGITGLMTVLHASLSEYLLLFGSPVGTEGFSGRYRIDIYDYVLAGEMWTYRERAPGARIVSRPGDDTLLAPGHVKGVRLQPETWLLEYGRGAIPTCLPMALGDSVFSALDGTTILRTVKVYGAMTLRSLLRGKL
mgnify:CR=1 FL=1